MRNNQNIKMLLIRMFCLCIVFAICFSTAGCGSESSDGKADTSASSGGNIGLNANDVDEDVLSASKVANNTYDGKAFKFLYTWEPGEMTERMVEAFNIEHDANVEIDVNTASIYQTLATAIAGGKPYDLVCTYNHRFPNVAIQGLLTPLNDYYDDVDLYDSAKPHNGGLNKEFIDFYSLDGKSYLVGSAKSVYQMMMIYNKKLFRDNGLEDPWELYKSGEWNWEKFMEMANSATDTKNGVAFTSIGDIWTWLNVNCINIIEKEGDSTFKERTTEKDVIEAVKEYQELYLGKKPICLKSADMFKGTAFVSFVPTNAYSTYAENAQESTAFDRKATNLGACPVPITNLNTKGLYPLHAAVGYGVCMGASDPSVAICYALFESRSTDSDTGEEFQLNPDVYDEIVSRYNEKPFLSYSGFTDSNGLSVAEFYRDTISKDNVLEGADVVQTLTKYQSTIKRMISDSLKK